MTEIIEVYITFGVQYGTDPDRHKIHPLGMTGSGYAVIEAPDRETARAIAHAVFGNAWAFDYSKKIFFEDVRLNGTPRNVDSIYTDGELLRIKWMDREKIEAWERVIVAAETVAETVFGKSAEDWTAFMPKVNLQGGEPVGEPAFVPPDIPAELYNKIMALLITSKSTEALIAADELKNLYGASARRAKA